MRTTTTELHPDTTERELLAETWAHMAALSTAWEGAGERSIRRFATRVAWVRWMVAQGRIGDVCQWP